MTGKGANYIVIDDPMKAVDAPSDAARNAVYDWVKGSLMTRFDKPAEGRMIVVMQRLHQDDLIGRLLADGGWTLLEMPGKCIKQQVFDLGNGNNWIFKPGDYLFQERFGEAAHEQLLDDLSEGPYNTQILQRPGALGGTLFKFKNFQRYEKLPPYFEAIVQSVDPASAENETAAFTVCTTWGIVGRKLYLIHVFRKRLDFYKVETAILSLKKEIQREFRDPGGLRHRQADRQFFAEARRQLRVVHAHRTDYGKGRAGDRRDAEDRTKVCLLARRGGMARDLRIGARSLPAQQICRSG